MGGSAEPHHRLIFNTTAPCPSLQEPLTKTALEPSNETPQKQKNDRAESSQSNGPEIKLAGCDMAPAESSTEIAPDEGSDDTKNYRDDAT